MLNISTPLVRSVSPVLPLFHRRRGGQPLNHNALNHGLYASKNRTPLTEIAAALPAYPRSLDTNSPAVARQLILGLTGEIGLAYQKLRGVEDNRSMIAWFNTVVSMVSLVGRLKVDFVERFVIGSDLHVVSGNALALIHNSFWEKGIIPETHSFRANIAKSDFNSLALQEALCPSVSRSPFPFLTPRQWAVLEPLVPPVERSGRRGRPFANPRILLDAIFWKLAHHARWQDLPPCYPSMHTCRRYYRSLFLSGCLDDLLSALYRDLLIRGKVSLHILVEKKAVAVSEKRVIMRPGLEKSWQMRAALLILQQGYLGLQLERSKKFKEYRQRNESSRRTSRDKEIQARASMEEQQFAYSPIDLAHLGLGQENRG